mmetsp:Transcript_30621/g.99943  ORF Transcript_30621/g.99943 Transcript_30621/m.99943 type:complete len:264 (-) Transcript_30621:247-1038(-)
MPARRRRRSAPPSTASFGARTLPFSAPAQSTTRSALCLRRTLPSSLASCARWRRLSPRRRARASPSLRSCRIPTFCGVRYGRVGAKRVGGYGPGRRRRPARRVGGYGQSLERPRYNRVRTQYTAAVHSRGHDADSRRPRPLRYCRGPSRRDAASTSAPGQLAARRRRARRCAQLLRWYACVLHRTARRCDCTACRPHDGREASDKRRFPWRRPRSQQAEGAQNCRHDGPAGRTEALSRGLRESRPRALHLLLGPQRGARCRCL